MLTAIYRHSSSFTSQETIVLRSKQGFLKPADFTENLLKAQNRETLNLLSSLLALKPYPNIYGLCLSQHRLIWREEGFSIILVKWFVLPGYMKVDSSMSKLLCGVLVTWAQLFRASSSLNKSVSDALQPPAPEKLNNVVKKTNNLEEEEGERHEKRSDFAVSN